MRASVAGAARAQGAQGAQGEAKVATPHSAATPSGASRGTAGSGAPFVRLAPSGGGGTGGSPLRPEVRAVLEARLGVDLAPVRVHQGSAASQLVRGAGANARAFALGRNIYLGINERATDLALMAHEVAHVVQQQGGARIQRKGGGPGDALEHEAERVSTAVVRGEPAVVTNRTGARPQFSFGSWLAGAAAEVAGAALDFIRDHARLIPGYDMLGFIIGRDPITAQPVQRNAVTLIRALMGLWPGGSLVYDALQRYGIVDRVGDWLKQQMATLTAVAAGLPLALDRFLATLGATDLFNLGGVWDRASRIFSEPVTRIVDFVVGLVTGVLGFIRQAVVMPLARLAEGTRGYDLLRAILGEDPVTHEPYPRTPANLIGGFMKLIGQEEKWRYLQESGAIPRVWAWFQQQMGLLMGFVRQVPQLFTRAWASLQISDLLDLGGAFNRMRGIFGAFISDFVTWAGNAAMQVMMFIFEALAPGAMPVLRRAMSVMRIIIGDPIRFVGNLVRAGLKGFEQFRDHIRTHLVNGLVGWLTGALTGAGLQLPARWDLRGILSLVLQILGLTWQNIRVKMVRVMGETAVTVLETTFDIVTTLVREGPAAEWDKILEQLAGLQEMVFGGIRDWVARTIVGQAVIKIVSMLNPAGAVIQAIIAIYNTIMFFRERLQQIVEVAESFFNSVAQIAAGAIGAAADRVEQTMVRLVPVVISFLARLIGLGGISDAIKKIIDKIRAPIDKALDKVVDWIAAQAVRLGKAVVGGAKAVAKRFSSWWTLRKTFKAADGETHSLFFAGEGAAAVLKVKSDEEAFELFVTRAKVGTDAKRTKDKADALVLARSIDDERKKDAKTDELKAAQATKVNDLLEQLKPLTVRLFGKTLPPSFAGDVNTKPNAENFATGMRVSPLTSNAMPKGTDPTGAANARFAALNERRESPGGSAFYIKGHLLNQKLGGPGDWKNLVPLSLSGNSQHERKAEAIVKRTVDLAAIVEYTVTPAYKTRSDKASLLAALAKRRQATTAKKARKDIIEAEDWVPDKLEIQAVMLDESLKKKESFLSVTIPDPVPRDLDKYYLKSEPVPPAVNLSTDSAADIAELKGIGPVYAALIVSKQPYRRYEQLAEAAPGIRRSTIDDLIAAGHVRLF